MASSNKVVTGMTVVIFIYENNCTLPDLQNETGSQQASSTALWGCVFKMQVKYFQISDYPYWLYRFLKAKLSRDVEFIFTQETIFRALAF